MALSSFWTEIDPLNDCTVTEAGGKVSITIPSGTVHDSSTTNKNYPAILQSVSNTDFDIKTKLDTELLTTSTAAGIMIREDANNFIAVNYTRSSSTVTKAVALSCVTGTVSVPYNVAVATPTYPVWLRVERVGNDFKFYTSTDGSSWTLKTTVTRTMTVNQYGLYAATGTGAPALTVEFDLFYVDDFYGQYIDMFESVGLTDLVSLTKIASMNVTIAEGLAVEEATSLHKLLNKDVTIAEGLTVQEASSVFAKFLRELTINEMVSVVDVIGLEQLLYLQQVWILKQTRLPAPEVEEGEEGTVDFDENIFDEWAIQNKSNEGTVEE